MVCLRQVHAPGGTLCPCSHRRPGKLPLRGRRGRPGRGAIWCHMHVDATRHESTMSSGSLPCAPQQMLAAPQCCMYGLEAPVRHQLHGCDCAPFSLDSQALGWT